MMIVTDGDIGEWVSYSTPYSTLYGRIKSFNDKFIFVVFHCDGEWDHYRDYTGSACRYSDLKFTDRRLKQGEANSQ